MKFIISVLLFALTPTAFASIEKKEIALQDGSRLVRALYAEEGLYYVDTFHIDTSGDQERLEQKTFSREPSARKYFAEDFKFTPSASTNKRTRAAIPVWEVRHEWDADWEFKFSQWIKANVDTQFFVKYNVPTDCADVAFALRWIFARIHGLPAAVSLFGSGKIFSQADGKEAWVALPTAPEWNKDERFLAALNYVFKNTFTHTLVDDSYPLVIKPSTIVPGVHHLTLREVSGHTRLIVNTEPSGVASKIISFVASDVPAKVRKLNAEPFAAKKFIPEGEGGFMRFRWPKFVVDHYELVKAEDMPGYSLEQFQGDFQTFYYKAVTQKLGMKNQPAEYMKMQLGLAWEKLGARVRIVKEGYHYCQIEDCGEDTMGYEDWSTPSRDTFIYEQIFGALETYWDNEKDKDVKDEMAQWLFLTLDVDETTTLRYQDLMGIWTKYKFSSDPRDPVQVRWGY